MEIVNLIVNREERINSWIIIMLLKAETILII